MKYIKLFENFFSKIDFGNQLWIETNDWENWDELVWNEQPEELSQIEIVMILNEFFNKKFKIGKISLEKRTSNDKFRSCLRIDNENESTIIIYKFRDDMWMIEIFEFVPEGDKKFVCDGTDGLSLWLSDWIKKLR
jgi:hypothetical protein